MTVLKFISTRFLKDVYLGVCFVMLFNAFNVLTSVQKTITVSIEKDNPSVHLDGYVSLGIVYTTLSLGTWLAPGIIAKTGPKYAMIIGTFFYLIYVSLFYTEQSFWIYLGAALCGFGASVLWTGQANYTVLNSEVGKAYSSIGVFWILFQSSHFFGNMIIYFQFNDINQSIDRPLRVRIVVTLVAFIVIAILMMFGIRPPLRNDEDEKIVRSPTKEIAKSTKILTTPKMLLLIVTMTHIGIHLTFLSVLSASMGFSKYLSANSKELAPLCGIFQGVGEILGGFLTIFIGGKKLFKVKSLITVAVLSNLVCYVIAFLMLPNNSARSDTNDLPILLLPHWLLILAALLSALGEACLQTEVIDHIGNVYPNDSASAYAVTKFICSVTTAISFYYAEHFDLYTQLVILIVFNFLSWITYHYLQWFYVDKARVNDDDGQLEMKTKT